MGAIALLLYSASLVAVFMYFFLSLRRSEFGMILVGYDLFFFLGCCVYPLVLEAGLITPGANGHAAMASIGKPGLLTAIHVFGVALGMFLGYLFGRESGRALSRMSLSRYQDAADFIVPRPAMAWRAAILIGLVVMAVYIWAVGLDVALINANLARAGVFEGFGEDAKWLFLKTIVIVCAFSSVFLPAVLMSKTDRGFLVLYVVFVLILFLISPSRGLFLSSLFVPVMVYLQASRSLFKPRVLIALSVGTLAAALILIYGKYFFRVPVAVLAGDAITQVEVYESDSSGVWGVVEALLRNMEFQWYSIEAGMRYFAAHGPLLPVDVLLAPIGFVPVRVMEWLGLGYLNYGNAEVQLACVNTEMFLQEGCSVPPLYTGYSAYLAPIAGGLILSFLRNWCFGYFESIWMDFRKRGFERLWFPFLGAYLVAHFSSFIAPNIAIGTFVLVSLMAYGVVKSIKTAFLRRLSATY